MAGEKFAVTREEVCDIWWALAGLADAGECEILAPVSATRCNASVGAVDVINHYYGRGTYRMVGNKGDDEWAPDAENGPHLRITEKLSKAEVVRVIDELMTRKPLHGGK